MRVKDLAPGDLYRIAHDDRIGGRVGTTPLEQASRLSLYILKKVWHGTGLGIEELQGEPWVYVGPKMVYGGRNGDQVIREKVHHFVRPNGKRLYIYGNHVKHIKPFTSAETVPTV